MSYQILIDLTGFALLKSDRAKERCVEYLIDALAKCNLELLKSLAPFPPIYAGHVSYDPDSEDQDVDRWKDIVAVHLERGGDCDDLTPARLAELWSQGIGAKSVAHLQRNSKGDIVFHITLKRDDGFKEDPSERLGMT